MSTRTTYRMVLDNGDKVDIDDISAASAIYVALKQNVGRKVKRCQSGLTEKEAEDLRASGVKAMAGLIQHDIPEHRPLTREEAESKRPRKTDSTTPMFDDEVIASESKSALAKANYKPVFDAR